MDWILLSTVLALLCFGLIMVYSASAMTAKLRYHWPAYHFFRQQCFAAAVALAAMIVVSWIDYRRFRSAQWAFAGMSIAGFLLILVYVLDPAEHRWLRFGLASYRVSVQPSEFAKPVLITFLAWFLSERKDRINNQHTIWPTAIALAFFSGLILAADLGTALVLAVMATVVLMVAGLSWRHVGIAVLAGIMCLAAAVAWKPYRLYRILIFYDPGYEYLIHIDPEKKMLEYAKAGTKKSLDPAYQGEQSLIAIASNGTAGAGIGKSRQKLLFLPDPHTDFIFSIIVEELGLAGGLGLLLAYGLIGWRGVQQFLWARDDFGRFLAIGISSAIVFQALFNISVALCLIPTKGFPLPLISYGGTSLVSTMVMIGLLLSVSQRAVSRA
jgi:cell division protein FtsW